MKIGDLIRIKDIFTSHGIYEGEDYKIGMIVEGPNEVGKIRILFSSGERRWLHSGEVEYVPSMKPLKK
jgi:hypothetical protein